MKSQIIPKFIVREKYPFSKWERGEIIYPTKKELIEIRKFRNHFEEISVTYEILKKIGNEIISVKHLFDGRIFSKGDKVSYITSWNENPRTITFVISGFMEQTKGDVIIACKDDCYQMCGIGILKKEKK